MADPILQVSGLSLRYQTRHGDVRAVDDVSFELLPGQVMGLVGESGSGKTSVAISLIRLLPDNARISAGRVLLDGHDLLAMSPEEVRSYRWRRISMIFQAAMNSLDPVYRVGDQIMEAIETHDPGLTRREAEERITGLFELVGLDPQLARRYPHEYSGGMRQRAVIAMSLACQPDVVIADEPTTALGCDSPGPHPPPLEGNPGRPEHEHSLHHPRPRRGRRGHRPHRRDVRGETG